MVLNSHSVTRSGTIPLNSQSMFTSATPFTSISSAAPSIVALLRSNTQRHDLRMRSTTLMCIVSSAVIALASGRDTVSTTAGAPIPTPAVYTTSLCTITETKTSLVPIVWYNSTCEYNSYTSTITSRDYNYECSHYPVTNYITSKD
jgi:hypothetical protein